MSDSKNRYFMETEIFSQPNLIDSSINNRISFDNSTLLFPEIENSDGTISGQSLMVKAEMISNEEMTKEMIEESIDEMEEDQNRDPNHPDFGTRYTDWSRNPEDYL